ncbi:G patch domain and ankyrin repeat-containing protein 1 homolog [Diachasma alloeum]|uniref:G patch domain and ankyrin repeat-containing protein 1 homolog n=1 Tax=Diachasma alloeum TaxID=454923 RepID=UPI00073810E0|nr:G patch domain and ankyrin repeat-containing protein 1 homolog [Diachasma alloeum]
MLSYKIFLRQSETNPEPIVNKYKGELTFRGDEARKAYDEIITRTYSKAQKKAPTNCHSHYEKSHTSVGKKNAKSTGTQQVKITANAVLKSIEQTDWDFMKQNITKENVNVIDDYGWTPLMLAAYNGNTEIVEYLLTLGADKSMREKAGLDAVQLARKSHRNHIISLLEGGKPRTTDGKEKHENYVKLSAFYCSVCKTNFRETTVKEHESSLLHVFNTNPKLPDPIYGIPKGNKGYQIMVNSGWEESKGLGPSGSGSKYPVKTVLKRDREGLGRKNEGKSRVTHFKSNDVAAIRHVRQERLMKEKSFRRKNREEFLSREARKERALRRALS